MARGGSKPTHVPARCRACAATTVIQQGHVGKRHRNCAHETRGVWEKV